MRRISARARSDARSRRHRGASTPTLSLRERRTTKSLGEGTRKFFNSALDLRRAGRHFERLDYLLGRNGLVRRAWRFYLAAMGMVGRGTRVGPTKNEMAISLAGAIRVPARHRRFSVHGFDVAAPDRVAVDQNNVGAASEPRESGH